MLRIFSKRTNLSDEELLTQYQSTGDLELLGQLYERYVELVYGVCLKYLNDEPDAEDASMAIFEELVTKVKEHEIQNFRSWLYVLSKNHCLMKLRKEKRNITVNFEPELMHSVDPGHPTFEIMEENGQEMRLRECLEGLSEEQKQCIKLFYYEGQSYKEIAEGRSEQLGKVRSHIQNGRRNLRLCMDREDTRDEPKTRSEKRK